MSDLKPLLPERHPQTDMFFCDISDAVIKDDMASMEHPIFALTKQPYMKARKYENGGNWFEVIPSDKGIANIYDKDILIFAISQIMAAKNEGREYGKHVSFVAHDYLVFSNKGTSGREYDALKDSLRRLGGTRLETNIKTGDQEVTKGFGLVDSYTIRRETLDGRVLEWGITLSDWLFNAIESNQVLTLNPRYFRLRKPLERRLYEIARKHCGIKDNWRISIDLLQNKCGSTSPKKKFRFMLKHIEEHDHLPDYRVSLDGDMVIFHRTGKVGNSEVRGISSTSLIPALSPSTLEKAGEWCRAKRLDKYALEAEWREWASQSPESIQNVDAAFLGFVKKKVSEA